MEIADLTRKDEKRVRSELESHMQELLSAGEKSGLTESEVMSMIEKEFGKPEELGKMIAKARGKFRTYLKKQARGLLITIVVAIILAFILKASFIEEFRITSDALSPRVPKSSRVMINKLTKNFRPGDIIIFKSDNYNMLGIVKEITEDKNNLIITRNNEEDKVVAINKIKGKAFLLYSFSP
jgi:hypothetical protein